MLLPKSVPDRASFLTPLRAPPRGPLRGPQPPWLMRGMAGAEHPMAQAETMAETDHSGNPATAGTGHRNVDQADQGCRLTIECAS